MTSPAQSPFRQDVAEAALCLQRVRKANDVAELAQLRLGALLRHARDRALYRASGYDSLKDWIESPDVDLPYRKSLDLIRIVELLEPVLGEALLLKLGSRHARALLPLVERDEHGRVSNGTELLEAARAIEPLTWMDASIYVRELRGRKPRRRRPRVWVSRTSDSKAERLEVFVDAEDRSYRAGELRVDAGHAPAILERIGQISPSHQDPS